MTLAITFCPSFFGCPYRFCDIWYCSICRTVDIDVIWHAICTKVCRCFSFRSVVLYSCLILFFSITCWWNEVAQYRTRRNADTLYVTQSGHDASIKWSVSREFFNAYYWAQLTVFNSYWSHCDSIWIEFDDSWNTVGFLNQLIFNYEKIRQLRSIATWGHRRRASHYPS